MFKMHELSSSSIRHPGPCIDASSLLSQRQAVVRILFDQ